MEKKNENRIWVIGGANMDIIGSAHHPLKEHDSNIGSVRTYFGGVGRNIAQASSELGENVIFVTCFGSDDYGDLIEKHCRDLGIDTSFSIKSSRYPTSTYIAILDENRDMHIAMNDMEILEEITKEVLDRALKNMTGEDIMVIDSNFKPELIEYLVNNSPARIAADPVSAAKVPKLGPVMDRINIFKPNAIETKELTGIDIINDKTAKEAARWFLEKGVEEILITLGKDGVICGTRDRISRITHKTVEMNSANGGGDAMFGAYLAKRHRGNSVSEAVEFAIAAAIFKITEDKELGHIHDTKVSREELREKEKAINDLIDTLEMKEIEL